MKPRSPSPAAISVATISPYAVALRAPTTATDRAQTSARSTSPRTHRQKRRAVEVVQPASATRSSSGRPPGHRDARPRRGPARRRAARAGAGTGRGPGARPRRRRPAPAPARARRPAVHAVTSPGSAIRLHAARASRSSVGTAGPPAPSRPSAVDDHAATAGAGAQGERQAHVRPGRRASAVEVAHGPRQLEHPVVAAQRERAPLDRPVEVDGRLARQPEGARRIIGPGTSALTCHGVPASRSACTSRARSTRSATTSLASPDGWAKRGPADGVHLQLEVDPVQQRPHQLAHVVAARPSASRSSRPPCRTRARRGTGWRRARAGTEPGSGPRPTRGRWSPHRTRPAGAAPAAPTA